MNRPSAIEVRFIGDVVLVAFDDGKANVLNLERISQLHQMFDEVAHQVTAVVVAGRPGMFCAGLDLATMRNAPPEQRDHLRSSGIALFQSMVRCPVPVVAACTGHAIAAGAMMLLTADLRVGAAGAYRVGLSEVAVGVPVSAFGMEVARLRLGSATYLSTVLGTVGTAEQARQRGFLDIIVDDPVGHALQQAEQLGKLARHSAFWRTKATFYREALARQGV